MKKRTKKLLFFWRALAENSATAKKSFLLLFFKKEVLSFCLVRMQVFIASVSATAAAGQQAAAGIVADNCEAHEQGKIGTENDK